MSSPATLAVATPRPAPAVPLLGPRAAGVLLAATYAVAVLSVALRPGDNPVAVWWPAAALSVLLVALCPRGVVPLVGAVAATVVVTGLANLTGGRAVDASLAFGVSNGGRVTKTAAASAGCSSCRRISASASATVASAERMIGSGVIRPPAVSGP